MSQTNFDFKDSHTQPFTQRRGPTLIFIYTRKLNSRHKVEIFWRVSQIKTLLALIMLPIKYSCLLFVSLIKPKDTELRPYLEELVQAGKKIFLITNSPFETVDVGMKYMVGEEWRDLFEVSICK